jgi:hypothetical protein
MNDRDSISQMAFEDARGQGRSLGGATTSESVDSLGEGTPSSARSRGQKKGHKSLQSQPCRQLPCRTFLSCGTCSFGGRCLFLHPLPLKSSSKWPEPDRDRGFATKYSRGQQKAHNGSTDQDAFYFPTMSMEVVSEQLDAKGLPLISQEYVLPSPYSSGKRRGKANTDLSVAPIPQCLSNRAAYLTSLSVWHHLLDSLKSKKTKNDCYERINKHTGNPRLPVFAALGCGQSVA